ncbi:pectinesterase family protein [Bacillus sp. 3255]|uniref:pectinesterase family protein n=1 Tax=Bacillus sp. 3255 TaxID=2817904 RepID=UPI002861B6CB|nr:pectinesterase family protein [Bacillus sp. 3255]MDR6884365.1 pectin methylesterase-like acyl-CoA thioesterase/lysophospholipase L1-like esterase [Bacillus sp. 3255]
MIIIVAADGSGDYTRIQDAIDRAEAVGSASGEIGARVGANVTTGMGTVGRIDARVAQEVMAGTDEKTEMGTIGNTDVRMEMEAKEGARKGHTVIYVRSGVYKEKLRITKPGISVIGESAETTIVTYDDYAKKLFPNGEPYHTFNSYTAFVGADDVTIEHLTIENTAGRGEDVGQALAAYADGDRVVFRDCRFLGHQDTLFTGPLPPKPRDRSTFGGPREGVPPRPVRQYYERCYIRGDVDFIFGSATAVFQDCEIESAGKGWVTAASTPEEVAYGYVFVRCKLTGEAPAESVGLGRPWRNYAKTAFLRCWLGPHIKREGWDPWNERECVATIVYAEYGNSGPGADTDCRVEWSKQLSEEEAAAYDVNRILAGQDGWSPIEAGIGNIGVGERIDTKEKGPEDQPVKLYLAGDSTMSNYKSSFYPRMGWGQVLDRWFGSGAVVCNAAASGRSSKSYITEGRLNVIWSKIRPGDYLFIQFGHNDQKEDEKRYTEPYTTYLDHLRRYVEGARSRGALPVLITPVQRRSFDEQGSLADTHGEYPSAVRRLAAELEVPLIDLAEKSKRLFESLGAERTKALLLWLQPGEHPNYPDGVTDDTHFSEAGATEIARLVVEGIKELGLPLARLLRE